MDDEQYFRLVARLEKLAREAEPHAHRALHWLSRNGHMAEGVTTDMVASHLDSIYEDAVEAPADRGVIIGLLKDLDDLKVGRFHYDADNGLPRGTFEFYGSSKEIAKAALGEPHLMEIRHPGETIDEVKRVADRLRRWAKTRSLEERLVLSWMSNARPMTQTTISDVRAATTKISKDCVKFAYKDMEALGLGRFDKKAGVMEWFANTVEIAKASFGEISGLHVFGPEGKLDEVVVERPGGLITRVRNGEDEAAILVEVRPAPEPGDNGKLLDLKMISNLGSFAGEIRLNEEEDWRAVLTDMPTQDFLEFFGGDRSKSPIHADATKVAFRTLAYGPRSSEIPKPLQNEARTYVDNALSFLEKGGPEMEEIFLERVSELSRDYPALYDLDKHVQKATPEEVTCIERMWHPFQEDLKNEMKLEASPEGAKPTV